MMHKTLLVVAIFCSFTSLAQEFSIGLRTGVGKNFYLRKHKYADFPVNATWNKQVYARYQAKKRFAVEIGATQYTYKNNSHDIRTYENVFDAQDRNPREIYTTSATRNISFYLSLQYDIMCYHLKTKPIFNKIRSYIGISLAPMFISYTEKTEARDLQTEQLYRYGHNDHTTIITGGINHTVSYKYNDYLSLTSVLSYHCDINGAFAKSFAGIPVTFQNHISYLVGIGYTF